MTKFNLRLLFSILAVFAVMAFAVACGDDDDDEGDDGDDGTPAVTAPSGTIRIGASQFETWDPHFSDFAQDIAHFYLVWRGLYQFDNQSKPIPSMADGDPQVSSDGKTYTVKLKPDLKWSDGEPLTAKDFVLGMQRTCNPDIAGHYQYIMTAVAGCDDYYAAVDKTAAEKEALLAKVGVRAVDDTTVEYKLREAQPTFPILLAMWPAFPVPSHIVTTVDATWPGPLENAYNGPFMPSAYTEQDSLELALNPNWVKDLEQPKVEKIVLRYIDDAAVMNDAYRNDELDAVVADSAQLSTLKTEFPDELHLYPATRTIGLEYNLKDPLMAKADVRLALSRATDRDTMMRVVFQEGNTATTNWVPPARSGKELNAYADILGFDEDAAKKHLADAGYANGQGFPGFTLLLTDTALNQALGAFLQEQWKDVLNIDIKLEFVDSPTRASRFNNSQFQLVTGGWQEDYPDPENWFLGLWETGGSINKTGTSIPALDQLIDDAKFNTNNEERLEQYSEAEDLLLEEASGIAPLWHTLAKFLVKPSIKGMVENQRPGDTFVPGGWDPEFWSIEN
jgi:oligopeptide transport system substrate-binding protein